MTNGVFRWTHEFQILGPIVLRVDVPMVNIFITSEPSTNDIFHDEPVLVDAPPRYLASSVWVLHFMISTTLRMNAAASTGLIEFP